MNFYTKENFGVKKNSTDDVSRLLSSKLLLGWALLDDCCNIHFHLKECVLCVAEQEHCNNRQANQKLRPIDECLEKNENNNYEKDDMPSLHYIKNSELSESLQILECASNNVFSSLKRCCATVNSLNTELELHLISKIKMCAETLESLERCKAYFEKKP
ncbi:hypothetical protein PMAC_000079 [Pneumocystis sp. 'macacae']|nr:hypothetical protein PMAC_000079 [Pneumocystis sp. 'macacae']